MKIIDSIICSAEGFHVHRGEKSVYVPWNSIREIAGYKWDLFSYDLICLALTLQDETSIEVDEQMRFYKDLVIQLESRFKFVDDWWSKVAFPPFETNYTVLWKAPE